MPKFNVAESIEIAAPPHNVFDVVANFDTWTTWSPWLCSEPDATVEVTENPNSVGSIYKWNGNIVGEGEIEHLALDPGVRITEDLRFIRPWESQADVSFDFEKVGEGTRVTWTMDSSLPWFMFWMVSTMKSMIGMDYERGLKMLKEYIETGNVLTHTTVRGVEEVGPLHVVGVRKSCQLDAIGPMMDEAIAETANTLKANNVSTDGENVAVYHKFDMKTRTFDFTAGYIVPSADGLGSKLSTWTLPASRAFAVEHLGSYENLGNGWSAAYQHARHKKLKQSKVGTFEIYRNSPDETAKSDLKTDIYLPLK